MNKLFTWMKQSKLTLLLALILAVGLLVGGCGGGGSDSYTDYTQQSKTKTATPLIEVDTLKSWMDAGIVNAGQGYENVVIFHVSSEANYNAGFIPGSHWLDQSAELYQNRLEALAYTGSMVADGPTIDAVMQRAGVNSTSTIVLSWTGTGTAIWEPSRAYWTLRYWGFPKERIKLLNGGVNAWKAAAWYSDTNKYAVTSDAPEVPASTFSVAQNGLLRSDLRVPLGRMIQVVDANIASVDAGGDILVNIVRQHATTPTMNTSIGRASTSFFSTATVTTATGDIEVTKYNAEEEVRAAYLGTAGVDYSGFGTFVEGLPSISHCGAARSCQPLFFAADAILGWEAAVFDGSTTQWGQYYGDPAGSDPLLNNAWNVNFNNRSFAPGTPNYSAISTQFNWEYTSNADPRASQIENEDTEYMTPASGDSGSAPGPVSGGDGGGC